MSEQRPVWARWDDVAKARGLVSFAVGFRVSACCRASVRRWCAAGNVADVYICSRCGCGAAAVPE